MPEPRTAARSREDTSLSPRTDGRRKQILDAAFTCFIRFGYSKVSVNDIAAEADISRTLVYHSFKSKEDIFLNMFSDKFDDQIERVRAVVRSTASEKEKLAKAFNILVVEMWTKLTASNEGADLLEACGALFPKIAQAYRDQVARLLATVMGDLEAAELLMLSAKGLTYDRPSAALLRRRLNLLIDRFV